MHVGGQLDRWLDLIQAEHLVVPVHRDPLNQQRPQPEEDEAISTDTRSECEDCSQPNSCENGPDQNRRLPQRAEGGDWWP